LDFGACREYSRDFTDTYFQIVYAASKKDRKTIIDASVKLGFLTGEENKTMLDAHTDAVTIIGELLLMHLY